MRTNGEFVDDMLERIRDYADINDILEDLKSHYTENPRVTLDYVSSLIKRIDHRVAEMYHTIDPMWFVVALHHRNKIAGARKTAPQIACRVGRLATPSRDAA